MTYQFIAAALYWSINPYGKLAIGKMKLCQLICSWGFLLNLARKLRLVLLFYHAILAKASQFRARQWKDRGGRKSLTLRTTVPLIREDNRLPLEFWVLWLLLLSLLPIAIRLLGGQDKRELKKQ